MIILTSVYSNEFNISILYDLLKERTPEQSISHKEMPTLNQHRAFMHGRPYFSWHIISSEKKQAAVGSIYLTHNREIGIFIFKKHQGNGYATDAIRMLMSINPGKFLANVNPNNQASINLFKKLGAKHIQNTFEMNGITWTDRDL